MTSPGFNAIPRVIQTSQDQLDEAVKIAHQCGDQIDKARNTLKTLMGVIDPNKIHPLMILFDNLEVAAHNGLVNQIKAMQAALEASK